jgi:hypothetical protein
MDNFDLKKYLAEGKLNEESNQTKTAIDWLCENIYTIQRELSIGNKSLIEKINQAKEIERQQIMDAFEFAQNDLGMEADEYINYMNLK